jgi:general secretion pathway protein D
MGGAYQQGGLAPGSPLGAAQLGARAGQPGVVPPGQTFAQRLQNIVNNVANAGEFQIIGEAKIIPDERTNTLLVFAGHEDLEMITNIVSKLDVELAQVLIEAIIMEVSLSDSKTFGVSAQQKPRRFSDILTSAGGGMNNGQSFSNIIGGGLPSGFSYAGALGPSWDVAIQAIANDSSINVLSAPRIMTFNYAEAHIFVGQSVPVISSSYYGLGTSGSSANYQFQDVGIDLDVKPLINQDGLVIMDITQSVNALGPNYTINGDQVPSQIKRDAEAKVAVRNGETILLGGFISSTINKSESGVPFLKDIPILGNLFKQHSKSKDRVELVVLIRPTVLSTADAAAKAATLETSKLPGVSAAKKAFEQENAERLRQVGQPSTVSKLK